ncbi:MAG: outer membrane beta-barrel protein [Methylocystis sp.]|uniref:outer membrane protein n=1 Tax=Methylocystis sp. TaxID=1911079 RepID=UPI0039229C26
MKKAIVFAAKIHLGLAIGCALFPRLSVAQDAATSSAALPLWTGFYGGLNVGAGWGVDGRNGNMWQPDALHGGITNSLTALGPGGGVIGGGQIGYNYALTPLALIGAEADFQGASLLSGSGVAPGYLQNSNGQVTYIPGWVGGGVSVRWFGTARARLGVTPLPTLLMYGTGGFAYAEVENAYGGSLANQISAVRTGWTAGGGVEWMFMPNWSVRAEYLFTDVSGDAGARGGVFGSAISRTRWNTLRTGLNYHFNWGGAPAIARFDAETAPTSLVPKSALAIGVGGNLNLTTFDQQNLDWAGTSNNLDGKGLFFGHGFAQWSTKVNLIPKLQIAPVGQISYFNHFADSNWLWGSKFSYTYLDAQASRPNVFIPQFGAFTFAVGGQDSLRFFGTGYLQSYQMRINHQLVLTPFIGRQFSNGFIYLGAGPSFSQIQTNLNNLTGFRHSQGATINQTELPANYQNSHWVWGGAATAGVTYFLTPSWFVDFNYTFSQTRSTRSYYLAWYAASVPGTDVTSIGYIPASTAGALNTQSFNASLNWAFDLGGGGAASNERH